LSDPYKGILDCFRRLYQE
jgi:solute carrier family 25 (mitochondrial adenine nucleotide translocator), member 4/5/6/31